MSGDQENHQGRQNSEILLFNHLWENKSNTVLDIMKQIAVQVSTASLKNPYLVLPNFHWHKGTELDLDLQTLWFRWVICTNQVYENMFSQYTLLIFESKNINYKHNKTLFYYIFCRKCAGLWAKFYFHFFIKKQIPSICYFY